MKSRSDPGEKLAHFTFAFRNDSDKPMQIKSVTTTCKCTIAKADKDTYAPGETGTVTATLDIGDHVGVVEKGVIVTTDATTDSVKRLTVRAKIKPVIEIAPTSVIWTRDEPAAAKVVKVTVNGKDAVKVLYVVSEETGFSVQVREIIAGREYELTVQPKSTTQPMSAAYQLRVEPVVAGVPPAFRAEVTATVKN